MTTEDKRKTISRAFEGAQLALLRLHNVLPADFAEWDSLGQDVNEFRPQLDRMRAVAEQLGAAGKSRVALERWPVPLAVEG